MIVALLFAVGILCISATITLGFVAPGAQNFSRVLIAGCMAGAISHASWIFLTKRLADVDKIFMYGFYWDAAIIVAALAIPMIFFHVKPSLYQWAGVGLITIGTILIKVK